MEWLKPTAENIMSSLSQIDDTPLLFGTYWENPLKYALGMTPKPDVIVFMTDGSCGEHSVEITEKVARKARQHQVIINTISLMEPMSLNSLLYLSEETGGTAIMIKSESEIVDLANGEILE